MTDIDWSKAPEGATHWEVEHEESSILYRASWMKQDGISWSFWDEGIWHLDYAPDDARMGYMIPRHAAKTEWPGSGLPPVGTVCETWHVLDPSTIKVRTILFVGQRLVVMTDDRQNEVTGRLENTRFRPIRTPEQIAEEEREKAIEEIAKILGGLWASEQEAAGFLYDAGYRKQEAV